MIRAFQRSWTDMKRRMPTRRGNAVVGRAGSRRTGRGTGGRSVRIALGLACAALGLAGCGTGSADRAQAGTSVAAGSVSASALPTGGTSPGPSASAAPPVSATRSAAPPPTERTGAGSATPSGGAAAAPAINPTTAATVRTSLATYTAESWTAQTAGPVRQVTGHDIALNECASVHGATTWQQQPYLSSGGNSAVLEIYTFGTGAEAGAAYQKVFSGMNSCQATSRALQNAQHVTADAVVRQTAAAADAAAFERTWTGVEGISAPGQQTNHLYIAAHGTCVLILHFDELAAGSPAGPYDVQQDPHVLSLLTNLLASQVGSQ